LWNVFFSQLAEHICPIEQTYCPICLNSGISGLVGRTGAYRSKGSEARGPVRRPRANDQKAKEKDNVSKADNWAAASQLTAPRGRVAGVMLCAAVVASLVAMIAAPSGSDQVARANGVVYQLNNGRIRFGGGGHDAATYSVASSVLADTGFLEQGFYWSPAASKWYKLSYSELPLDFAVGVGTGTSHWTGSTVSAIGSGGVSVSNLQIDGTQVTSVTTSGSAVGGYGTLISTSTATLSGFPLEFRHRYELGQNDSFVKITTTVSNLGSVASPNVNLWIGSRDDWVGSDDDVLKEKGNIENGAFTLIASASATSNAVRITAGSEGVLFYSTTPGVDMVVRDGRGVPALYNQPPASSPISLDGDDSYALYMNFGDVAVGGSATIIWYYAAGELADLAAVVGAVASAASGPTTTTPAAPVLPPNLPALVTVPVATSTLPPVTVAPSTTVVPSTTVAPSTSVPAPVPVDGGVLPALAPGESQVFVDGVPEVVEVFVADSTSLVLRGDGFELNLAGECSFGCSIRADADGRQVLELEENGSARVEGDGFKPGTPVYAWLFSDPTFLGELTVQADGSFAGSVSIAGIPNGDHTLQVNGTSADGKVRTANLGVLVSPEGVPSPLPTVLPSTGADTGVLVWVVLLTVLGGALVWTSRRRTVPTQN